MGPSRTPRDSGRGGPTERDWETRRSDSFERGRTSIPYDSSCSPTSPVAGPSSDRTAGERLETPDAAGSTGIRQLEPPRTDDEATHGRITPGVPQTGGPEVRFGVRCRSERSHPMRGRSRRRGRDAISERGPARPCPHGSFANHHPPANPIPAEAIGAARPLRRDRPRRRGHPIPEKNPPQSPPGTTLSPSPLRHPTAPPSSINLVEIRGRSGRQPTPIEKSPRRGRPRLSIGRAHRPESQGFRGMQPDRLR